MYSLWNSVQMDTNKELHIIQCLLDWSHSYLYIHTSINCSVQSPTLMSVPDTGLKDKTVQPETFFFLQRHRSRLPQSLCLETESLPPLLLNSPGIFPQTGSSDVLPVIQVRLFQLLQINSKNNSVTLTAPWFKVHIKLLSFGTGNSVLLLGWWTFIYPAR